MTDLLVRARLVQDFLDAIGPENEAQIAKSTGSAVEFVRKQSPSAWISGQHDAQLTAAAEALWGIKGAQKWIQKGARKGLEGPLLSPFVKGAVSLFGFKPKSLMRIALKAVSTSVCHFGDLSLQVIDENKMDLLWTNIPNFVFENESWTRSFFVSLELVFDVAELEGSTQTILYDPQAKCITKRYLFTEKQ